MLNNLEQLCTDYSVIEAYENIVLLKVLAVYPLQLAHNEIVNCKNDDSQALKL